MVDSGPAKDGRLGPAKKGRLGPAKEGRLGPCNKARQMQDLLGTILTSVNGQLASSTLV